VGGHPKVTNRSAGRAVVLHHFDLALYLIKKGKIDVNNTISVVEEYNFMETAAGIGDLEIIEWLIEEEDINIDTDTTRHIHNVRVTPLNIGTACKHVHVVKFLVEGGHVNVNKNIESVNLDDVHPLYHALVLGDLVSLPILRLLVSVGSRLSTNQTPVDNMFTGFITKWIREEIHKTELVVTLKTLDEVVPIIPGDIVYIVGNYAV
jgi:hypothetical protein